MIELMGDLRLRVVDSVEKQIKISLSKDKKNMGNRSKIV